MKHVSAERSREARVAGQKLLITRQQKIAAALYRSGQPEKARVARGKLLTLLHQLDLMQSFGFLPASTPRRNAH
jgi:hypothetical protein